MHLHTFIEGIKSRLIDQQSFVIKKCNNQTKDVDNVKE